MGHFQIAIAFLDYAAVFVFAATGALAAAQKRHDIVTFGFFAAVTGVGGGTLRDLLMGAPVFWIYRPDILLACFAAAGAIWLLGTKPFSASLLVWLDALGMSAYAIVGAAKALSLGLGPLPAIIMGVLTATFGGVIRDVLAFQPSVLLRREIYVTAALTGATIFVLLHLAHAPLWLSGPIGFAGAFGVRAASIVLGLALPSFSKGGPDEPPAI